MRGPKAFFPKRVRFSHKSRVFPLKTRFTLPSSLGCGKVYSTLGTQFKSCLASFIIKGRGCVIIEEPYLSPIPLRDPGVVFASSSGIFRVGYCYGVF